MSIYYKKHEHFPEYILVRKFEGEVNMQEVINSWKHLINNNLLSIEIKGVINDLTNCKFQMKMNHFPELIAYLISEEKIRKIKLAVITSDPDTIVFPVLGEKMEMDLMIKPFSTTGAAVRWIMN